MNLGAARRRLYQFDEHDGGAVENGRDSEYHIEYNMQHKDGYKELVSALIPQPAKKKYLVQSCTQRNSAKYNLINFYFYT